MTSKAMFSQSPQNFQPIAIIYCNQQQITPAKTIIFTEEFDGIISDIPEGVEHIQIRQIKRFQNLTCLPRSLKSLHIENSEFGIVELPDSLEYLELGSSYRGNIIQWPKSLKGLSVYNTDMSSMPPLPESLEYLRLVAPAALTHLKGLPKSLKTLIVPSCFGKNGEGLWLKNLHSLEHFEFSSGSECTSEDIVKYLPSGLKTLKGLNELEYEAKDSSKAAQQRQWPDSLECLEGIFNCKGPLPKNLRILKSRRYRITSSPLPESLEYLYVFSIEGEGKKAVSQLPRLKTLICSHYHSHGISLPSSLEYLEIRVNGYIDTKLPENLRVLVIPLDALGKYVTLPKNLETLEIVNSGTFLNINTPSTLRSIAFVCSPLTYE